MKKLINKSIHLLIIALAHLLINSSISAQAPQKMSYQAIIRNSNDSLLISTPEGMRISLVQGTPPGTVVFSETQTATTNSNGLVSLQIGMGTAVSGTFTGIDWAAGPYYVKTETDLSGGTNYTITSSNEILSVPYALFSANGTPGPQGLAGASGGGSGSCFSCPSMVSSPSDTTMYYVEASNYCINLTEFGHTNWRLPTVSEIDFLKENLNIVFPSESCWTKSFFTSTWIVYSFTSNFPETNALNYYGFPMKAICVR